MLIIHLFWDRLTNLVSRNINFRNFQGMKKYLGFLTKGKETFLLSMLCFLGTNFDLVGQCAVMPVGQTICAGEAITLEIPGVITSYSIHYTKLYDNLLSAINLTTKPAKPIKIDLT